EEAAHDPAYREQFNLVLCRAVAKLPVALELGLPFCAQGGLFITYKQGDIAEEMRQSEKALALLGGRFIEVTMVGLKGLEGRCLVVVEKVAPTSSRYPRRPGIPSKRPLI
ncbi:MAG: RsmG family class I SAM-dependent methyltransferase, partial [Chloroflexota bacterium]